MATKKKSTKTKTLSAPVVGTDGKAIGKVALPEALFGVKVNTQAITQAVRVYLANQRSGSASTKTRGEVEGSTRKIYRQKGTGRARHGAIRAPIFVGGGIVFGPKPRDFRLKLTKKLRRAALASSLTASFHDGKIVVIDGLEKLPPKTKSFEKALSNVKEKPALLVVGPKSDTIVRGARNLKDIAILRAGNLNPYMVLSSRTLIFTKQALPVLVETFTKPL